MIQAITNINNKEKVLFWSLFSVLLMAMFFYFVCINLTVRNVVLRENLEAESSKLALDISNKEFEYISMRNSLNIESAYAMGFRDATEKTFIKQNSGSMVTYASRNF